MTTSLARQLALLRTPGSVKSSLASSSSVYSGPFIIPEAESEHTSLASLKGCVAESLSSLCQLEPEMMKFTVLLELEEEEESTKNLVVECLTFLCPHMLNKHAQWMLQWLVIKHKVHINCPSWLIFSLLPYHSYKIYQTVIQNVDPTIRHDNVDCAWIAQFKSSCVPTSQPGLHRHTATNLAFFRYLCESCVQLAKIVEIHPDIKLHKQTTFLISTMLGGLENIRNISDEQVVLLLQVILAGMKSANKDLSSVSSVILAYLLPKVTLKTKVVQKLCKSLLKVATINQNDDHLQLALLIARTQKADSSKILELIVKLRPSINNLLIKVNNSDQDKELLDQIDCLIFSLATILEDHLLHQNELKVACNHDEVEFINIIHGLSSAAKDVTEDTAEFMVAVVFELSKQLEQTESNKAVLKKLTKIVEAFGEHWTEIYRKLLNENRNTDGDIFFIPSVENPSELQLKAVNIIKSNQLIEIFSNSILVEIIPGKGTKKILKNNMNDLSTVLSCPTEFLLSQFDDNKLEIVLINLLRVSSNQKTEMLTENLVTHICSKEMIRKMTKQNIVEPLMISILVTASAKTRTSILKSELGKTSSLFSLMSSLDPEADNFATALMEKLGVLLEPGHLQNIVDNNCLLRNVTLVATILTIIPNILEKSPGKWSEPATLFYTSCLQKLQTSKIDSENFSELISEARKQNAVPWSCHKNVLNSLLSANIDPDLCQDIFTCFPSLIERGQPEDCTELTNIILDHLGKNALKFLLKISQKEDFKTACLTLFMAEKYCKENVENIKSLNKNKADTTVLHLLSVLMSPSSKVQKAAFKVLDKLDISSMGAAKPILQFFSNHKEELVHNYDNMEKVLESEAVDVKSCRDILSRSASLENANIFIKLSPLFRKLTTAKDADVLFKFGSDILEEAKETEKFSQIVVHLIQNFVPIHIKNFNTESMWNFCKDVIMSKVKTVTGGLRRCLSQVLLITLRDTEELENSTNENLKTKFLSLLLNNSNADFYVEARNFLVYLSPSANMIMQEFSNVWGQDAFSGKRTSGRGKFSLLYGGGEAKADDIERWSKTSWLLEVTEKVLVQSNEKRNWANWLTLLRPMFVLLRKVSSMETEETAYKMTLLLNLMKHLLTSATDEDLQGIDQSQVDPELLVFCIRTSPNPDTRQSALQVLARCVVFNPDFILQNSITIFTFMGSHLLKVDSRHSFQVACQALDVLVPAIKTACQTKSDRTGSKLQTACLGVLTTFIDACLDIPAHRLTEFLVRLITCLGEKEYLWFAALLMVKKDKANGERKVVELFCQMGALNGIEALVRLLVNTRSESGQLRKMFGLKAERKDEESAKEKPDDWDLLRFRALQVGTSVLSSSNFKSKVSPLLGEEEGEELVQLMLQASILTLDTYGVIDVVMPARFRKNLVTQAEKVLENSLSLLPPSTFISQCSKLLASDQDSVRHRALEVVSSKLSTVPCPLPPVQLPSLVSPLVKLSLSETQPHTQQLALLAVRQLSKLLTDQSPLVEAAEAFSCSFLDKLTNAKVLGAAVLSCGDILTSLGPRVVKTVPGLVNWLADRLGRSDFGQDEGWTEKEVAVVFNSFLYCLQKLVESFVGFLNPSLPRLISLTCQLSGHDSMALARAKPLLSCLASTIPPHSVLAAAPNLLDSLVSDTQALPHLVNFVAENCRRLERNQLSSVSKQFVELYTRALGYRSNKEADPDKVDDIEETIISAFLSIALKLSLEDFAPVYQRLANTLAIGEEAQLITLFNLTNKVGGKLKSLFSFGLDSCVEFTTSTLRQERSSEVVAACLQCLTTVLKFNKLETVSVAQYEGLVSALLGSWILDHPSLVPCLVQLAISTPEDTNWKHLHFQTLLQLRDDRPNVRMAILSVLTECVTDRTDTYLPVLPDAVPFLQEILEDDDTNVEAACREFIQHMETVFGQNLESYFV